MGFLQSLFTPKEKIGFEPFTRFIVGELVKNKPLDLSIVDQDNVITVEEKDKIHAELEYFRVILLMFLLMYKETFWKKSYTSEEIGKAVGICYGLAYRDMGMDQANLEKKMETLNEKIDYYFNYISSIDEKDVEEKGVYFHLCSCFSDYILNSATESYADPAFVSKKFTVFDIAKQTYQNSEIGFNTMIKGLEFTD